MTMACTSVVRVNNKLTPVGVHRGKYRSICVFFLWLLWLLNPVFFYAQQVSSLALQDNALTNTVKLTNILLLANKSYSSGQDIQDVHCAGLLDVQNILSADTVISPGKLKVIHSVIT
jgi:hypothetical protein